MTAVASNNQAVCQALLTEIQAAGFCK